MRTPFKRMFAKGHGRTGFAFGRSSLDHDERRIPVGRRHERSIEARKFAAKTVTRNGSTVQLVPLALEQPKLAIVFDQ
jgi:hypothetical protein